MEAEVDAVAQISQSRHRNYLQNIDQQEQPRGFIHEAAFIDYRNIHDAQEQVGGHIRDQQIHSKGIDDGLTFFVTHFHAAIDLGQQHIKHSKGHSHDAQGSAGMQQEAEPQAKRQEENGCRYQKSDKMQENNTTLFKTVHIRSLVMCIYPPESGKIFQRTFDIQWRFHYLNSIYYTIIPSKSQRKDNRHINIESPCRQNLQGETSYILACRRTQFLTQLSISGSFFCISFARAIWQRVRTRLCSG